MEHLDAFMLARIQFAANITFHILFSMITISLAGVLLFSSCASSKPVSSTGWTPTSFGPKFSR